MDLALCTCGSSKVIMRVCDCVRRKHTVVLKLYQLWCTTTAVGHEWSVS